MQKALIYMTKKLEKMLIFCLTYVSKMVVYIHKLKKGELHYVNFEH